MCCLRRALEIGLIHSSKSINVSGTSQFDRSRSFSTRSGFTPGFGGSQKMCIPGSCTQILLTSPEEASLKAQNNY